MVFLFPINSKDDDSVTWTRVDVGDVSERVAKRKLRTVFTVWGIPVSQHKRLLKEVF